MAESASAFSLFHPKVKEWIYKEGWQSLNDAQVQAAFAIMRKENDLVISAPTASGKTEAAFLPLISKLIEEQSSGKQFIFYISPLKALINDQWQRLESLCKSNYIDVIPWHGDISASIKKKIETSNSAIILITPESMEAMLVNKPERAKSLSSFITSFIIDEFHAFIGQPRGDQLISLIQRFTHLSKKRIRRIALSATIGDIEAIANALNPKSPSTVEHINSSQSGQKIRLRVTGFEPPVIDQVKAEEEEEENERAARRRQFITYVASELFKYQKNTNLVFPNSRDIVEDLADAGNQLCNQKYVDRTFFAHHGFLSKEIREDIEVSARKGEQTMTICCTSTLELGIDLGSVDTVFQITAPFNVSSLRQRLGRSGRRGNSPILRSYICEGRLDNIQSSEEDTYLREGLIRTIACLELIGENWYEPPDNEGISPSIAAHQILSLLAQTGGAHVVQIWKFIEDTKAYRLSKDDFINILRHLKEQNTILQLSDGQISLSQKGEYITHNKDFYTVFSTPQEWSIYASGRIIARFPIRAESISINDCLLLAGRRWSIAGINDEAKSISVIPDKRKGTTPRSLGNTSIHTKIRQKMKEIYSAETIPQYLDPQAQEFLRQARSSFKEKGLDKGNLCKQDISQISWFPWVGSRTMLALGLLIDLFSGSAPNQNNGGLSLTCTLNDLQKTSKNVLEYSQEEIKKQLITYFHENRPGIFRSDSSKKWLWLVPDEIAGNEFIEDRTNIPEAISALSELSLKGNFDKN